MESKSMTNERFDSSTVSGRRRLFRRMHERGCFVIPNPWDLGSARVLEQLGFPALASTSAGFAWSLGAQDTRVMLDEVLAHLRLLVAGVGVPINADFEKGFAVEPDGVARNVVLAAETGIAALSIEDSTGDLSDPLFDFDLSVERIRAARQALDESPHRKTMLVGRSEGFISGRPDLAETIRRLSAYAEAGADCLYAPGLPVSDIESVVKAVAPRPVNVGAGSGQTSVAAFAAMGVRRISVGGALARAAWTGFLAAAQEIAEQGTFSALGNVIGGAELNARF
jgi:2-methylisocitrate lyase-like PEP mutase family enzyme